MTLMTTTAMRCIDSSSAVGREPGAAARQRLPDRRRRRPAPLARPGLAGLAVVAVSGLVRGFVAGTLLWVWLLACIGFALAVRFAWRRWWR